MNDTTYTPYTEFLPISRASMSARQMGRHSVSGV